MRSCIEDDCPAEGLSLPKWMHYCPICHYETISLEELEEMKNGPFIKMTFVDYDDVVRILRLLKSQQINWTPDDWEFIAKFEKDNIED